MSRPRPLNVLVVDDERYARQRVVGLLEGRDAVADIATATSGEEAIDELQSDSYDLVFLDVQMPKHTGIEVIDTVGPAQMPPTIFVTAYDAYALEAFDRAALDYLLKPFDDERFHEAFRRARERVRLEEADTVTDRLRRLLEATDRAGTSSTSSALEREPVSLPSSSDGGQGPDGSYLERLTVDLPGKVRVIPVEDVRYITAEDAYVRLHTDEETYLIRERMHVLEDRLDPAEFVRIHRSTIVQIDLIQTVLRNSGGDYAIRLTDRTELQVSRGRYDDLLERLERGTAAGGATAT